MKLPLTALALAAMVGNQVFAAGSAADNVSVNDPYSISNSFVK